MKFPGTRQGLRQRTEERTRMSEAAGQVVGNGQLISDQGRGISLAKQEIAARQRWPGQRYLINLNILDEKAQSGIPYFSLRFSR
jgi:hypothetical protein